MFFANYAIEQSIEDTVSELVIEEFLQTENPAVKKRLGNLMLRNGVRLSVEPIVPVHNEAKRLGLIARKPTDLHSRVQDFFVRNRRVDYHLALEKKWRPDSSVPAA